MFKINLPLAVLSAAIVLIAGSGIRPAAADSSDGNNGNDRTDGRVPCEVYKDTLLCGPDEVQPDFTTCIEEDGINYCKLPPAEGTDLAPCRDNDSQCMKSRIPF